MRPSPVCLAPICLAILVLAPLALPRAACAQELPPGAHPVLHVRGRAPMVVLSAAVDPSWARGRPRLLQRANPTVIARGVSLRRVPRALRAEARGSFLLSDAAGVVCAVRLGRPQILRHAIPEDASDAWDGMDGEPRMPRREVLREALAIDMPEVLVAPVIAMRGRCRTAAWASREPLVGGFAVTQIDPGALAAFRALEEYAYLAEEWEEVRADDDDPAATHWDERSGATSRSAYGFVSGDRRYTLIVARAYGGCGAFVGVLSALVEHTPGGPRVVYHETWEAAPSGLIDFDRDGVPEIVGFQRVVSLRTGESVDVSAPYYGCPC